MRTGETQSQQERSIKVDADKQLWCERLTVEHRPKRDSSLMQVLPRAMLSLKCSTNR